MHVIIQNLDQWIRCCVKRSSFSSGDYFVQQSRTGWVVLVVDLTRHVIKHCIKLFPIWTVVQEEILFRMLRISSSGGHLG